MKISDKKSQQVYQAISRPIVDLRIKVEKEKRSATDSELFDLEISIWRGVHAALKLEGPA